MSHDILRTVITIPSTSPALVRAITTFLNKEERLYSGIGDYNLKNIHNIALERDILEKRAFASYKHVSH